MKILGTGMLGLVGSRVVELLKDQYKFESSEVDVTDRESIINKIKTSDAPIVLHLAAKTDVDGCEKDREKDQELLNRHSGDPNLSGDSRISFAQSNERSLTSHNDEEWNGKKTAWAVNVFGTRNVADACQESKKKLIYASTDFVFDGKKKFYSEEDRPNPINWYSQTKYEGEKIVQDTSIPWIIVRLAYPYRSSFERVDFVRAILKRLQNNEKVAGVTDHIFTPTFIDDIAFAINKLIEKEALGIFHVVGSTSLSPYNAALAIAREFGLNKDLIDKTTRGEFFNNRAQRPFHLALKNDKIQRLGVKMRGFEEGLKEVKRQKLEVKITSQK